MARSVSSKNMASVGELTVIANIRQDLVDVRQTLTHATRLRMLLRTLYALRLAGIEEAIDDRPVGPLEKLEFLQFVRFAIFDNDTKFLLAVTFDGAWEPYIRAIAEQGGPLLDAIFCHCVGYNDHSSDHGYEVFSQWVRDHQVETDFFYADSPGATALDVRYSQQNENSETEPNGHGSSRRPVHHESSVQASAERTLSGGLRALGALHGLAPQFPDEAEGRFLGRTAKMILEDVDIAGGLDRMPPPLQLPHVSAAKWLTSFEFPTPPSTSHPIRIENPEDIQANILDQYEGMTDGCLLFVRIAEPREARHFLAEALELSAYSRQSHSRGFEPGTVCNLGLTFAGLRKLGVSEVELARLPREFQEGMEARAGWLGDLGVNHPSQWQLPKLNWPPGGHQQDLRVSFSAVDLVIQLQTRVSSETETPLPDRDAQKLTSSHPLFPAIETLALDGGSAIQILAVEVQRRAGSSDDSGVREHFGFRDGISQPNHEDKGPERDRVNLGEILLGYPDDRDGNDAHAPVDFCKNGTFMVIRKLQQDVRAFKQLVAKHRIDIPDLPSQMMGRDEDGNPVVKAHDDNMNDFDYEAGGRESSGPRYTHIRRTNPRNGPDRDDRPRNRAKRAVPRIVRRGLSYGPDYVADEADTEPSIDRGLVFACYNASIADQFEVIQRWISGGNSTGLPSTDNDPFMGLPIPGQSKKLNVLDRKGDPQTIELGRNPLVRLQWGLYLFVPAISALRELGRDAGDENPRDPRDPAVAEGEAIIQRMELLLAVEKLRNPKKADAAVALQWKKLIEDVSSRETMHKVWTAIRARGGALGTPYGLLVGSARQVMEIFRRHEDYSVSGYWNRMQDSLGAHYLGMDPHPKPMVETAAAAARQDHESYRAAVDSERYAEESRIANLWISSQTEDQAYLHAYETTTQVITELVQVMPGETILNLRRLVFDVVARMCPKWFALPDGVLMKKGGPYPAEAHCPDNFSATARYVFSPNPTAFVIEDGRTRGNELIEAAREFVRTRSRPDYQGSNLYTALYDSQVWGGHEPTETHIDFIARGLAGAIHGFVGPVGGSTISLLHEWMKSGELWRQQFELARSISSDDQPTHAETSLALGEAISVGMQIQPFPYILHRVPVRDVELEQRPWIGSPFNIPVRAGTRVVLGIVSATRDQDPGDTEVLFGGHYGGGGPVHACPGKSIAMGTIAGIVAALCRSGNLTALGPLSLSLSRD